MLSQFLITSFFFCFFLPFSLQQLANPCLSFFPLQTTLTNASLLSHSLTLPQTLIDDGYTPGTPYTVTIQITGTEKVNTFLLQVQNEDNTPVGTFLSTNSFQSVITCESVNDSLADLRLTGGQATIPLNLTSFSVRWISPKFVHLPTSTLSVIYTLGINRMLYQQFQSPSFALKDFCSPSPCQNTGSCVPLMTGGYTCVCPLSYFGPNCQHFNACASSPCLNDGVCSDQNFGFSCSCLSGYTGRQCEIDIDECQLIQDPCGFNGACIDGVNSYSCVCEFGYTGELCQENINDCSSDLCGEKGDCIDLVGDYRCDCSEGTAGRRCELSHECSLSENLCMNNALCRKNFAGNNNTVAEIQCICLPGFTGTMCGTSVNDCLPEPCQNGATCLDLIDTYLCECPAGFEGRNCSIEINECENLAICNRGLCLNNPGSFDCYCSNGFAGERCGLNIQDCFNHSCAEFSTCVDGIGEFTCSCPQGRTGAFCQTNVDLCIGEPCRNNATCIDGVYSHTCVCIEGYTGGSCEVELDECVSSPCLNNGTCIDRVNAFDCVCKGGYTGACCEFNINECSSDPCENGGECIDGINDFTCKCIPGFTSKTCSDDVDECAESLCENNSTCSNTLGGFTCTCLPGFTGNRCASDINECAILQPCLNGGECVNTKGNYSCNCLPSYKGLRCQTFVPSCENFDASGNSLDCENNGTCVESVEGVICQCPPGYTGMFCEALFDPCSNAPCSAISTCVAQGATYTCICPPGITGDDCSTDINECEQNICLNDGFCVEIFGSFRCVCSELFSGNRCEIARSICQSQPCFNNGTCESNQPGTASFNCTCRLGFAGQRCETQIDYCQPNPCVNSGSCTGATPPISVGTPLYTCSCPPGFTGGRCEQDVNECLLMPCSNNATCINQAGGYMCDCLPGYNGTRCEQEILECQVLSPCRNNASCVELIAGYSCLCRDGFTGVNCSERIDFCFDSPCNTGSCVNLDNGYRCGCPQGVTGPNCATDILECASQPCMNNGMCQEAFGTFMCSCLPGFSGSFCEEVIGNCTPSPCENGGICMDSDDGFQCFCSLGFTGKFCHVNINDCVSTPCLNGGSCVDGVASFVCNCSTGYEGKFCSIDIDSCKSNPCNNNATCLDLPGDEGYMCSCPNGYTGADCREDIDDCANRNCSGRGVCVDMLGGYMCNCDSMYSGGDCEVRLNVCVPSPCGNGGDCVDEFPFFQCNCRPGFTGELCGTDIDECAPNPCGENVTCIDGVNGFICLCPAGYTGSTCDTRIIECRSSPCLNNGTCMEVDGSGFSCNCVQGFTGEICERKINFCELESNTSNPCLNGRCVSSSDGFNCVCNEGFTGGRCEFSVPSICMPGDRNPCSNNGTCIEIDDGFMCICALRYTGPKCETEINECITPSGASQCVNGTCVDMVGDFYCVCKNGYTGRLCDILIDACTPEPCENGVCRTVNGKSVCLCYDGFSGEFCETNIDDCFSSPCQNGAVCLDKINGTTCVCASGYTGTYCEERISLCRVDTCMNGGGCIDDITEGFKCMCPSGYTGVICDIVILFCRNNSCLNNGMCVNIQDGFQCVCGPGYTGDRCEVEFNPCSSSPCSNNATCIPSNTSFSCVCPGDYYGANCQYYNNCIGLNCNNGACVNVLNSTSKPITPNSSLINNGLVACRCLPGFTGVQCQSVFDPCEGKGNAVCSSRGTCVSIGYGKYSCECDFGFAGSLCQTAVQSVSFSGNSYLELASIPNPLNQYSIDLSVQTNDSSALLLYTAQNTSQNEQFFDFLLLQIISGQVRAVVDCGSGPGTAQTNFNISDGLVHNVSLVREGRSVRLTVDGRLFTDTTNGDNDQQRLPLPLFLGGIYNYSTLPVRFRALNGFTGCIHSLTISTQSIALTRNFTDAVNTQTCQESPCGYLRCENGGTCVEDVDTFFRCECREGYTGALCEVLAVSCASYNSSNTSGIAVDDTVMQCLNGGACKQIDERFTCVCPFGYSGNSCQRASQIDSPFFNGEDSYIFFTSRLDLSLTFDISLSFRAFSPTGIILYSSQFTSPTPGDYTLLQLYNGYVQFLFDLGSGYLNLTSTVPVSLNTWHTVRVVRIGRLGHLYVNSQQPVSGSSPGAFARLNLGQNLYIGGIDRNRIALPATLQHSMGLTGCIGHINASSMPLLLSQATGGLGVESCPASRCNISHCLNGGACIESMIGNAVEVACSCQQGYSGDRCQNVIDVCVADNPCQAGGVCRMIGEGQSFICLCPLWKDGPTCEEDVTPILPQLSTPYSFMEFPIPPHISLETWNKIDLSITLNVSNASLPESSLRSLVFIGSLESNDFIYLLLQLSADLSENPHLQLVYNTGSGTQTVMGPAIQPGLLNNVCLTRYLSQFTLSINGTVLLQTTNPGPNTALNLLKPVIRIGALSSHFQQLIAINTSAVRSCVHKLRVNLFEFSITSIRGAEGRAISDCLQDMCLNSQPCLNGGRCVMSGTSASSSLVCLCRLGFIGDNCGQVLSITTASLSSYSSLSFQPIPGPISSELVLSLPIKLDTLSGVLLLASNRLESEFIRLVLSEGVLVLKTHLIEAASSQALLPSRWYNLTLVLNQLQVSILIDGSAYLELSLPNVAPTITSSTLDIFTIGSSILSQQSFQGCVGNITVIHDDVMTLFNPSTANGGWGVSQCVFSDQCSSSVCSGHGVCRLSQDLSFVCSCFEGFSGEICEIALYECNTSVVGCLNEGSCRVQLVDGSQQFECSCQLPFSGDKCQYRSTLTSAYFNAKSYLAFSSSFLSSFKSSTIIELSFMAESGEGVLFFAENIMGTSRQEYIYIGLRNGRVEFRFDLGTGSTSLVSRQSIELGKPTLLRANRNLQTGELYIDGALESSGISPGSSTYFIGNTDIYLGGVVNHELISPFGSPRGFKGCIGSIRVGFQTNTIPVPFSSATSGIDVRQC